MSIQQNAKMSFASVCDVIYHIVFGSRYSLCTFPIPTTTEETLASDKHLTTLNGPWKFIAGDNMQYAQSNYDDSEWETMDLTAPPGAHDDDVGLSGLYTGLDSQRTSKLFRLRLVPPESSIG
mgnify:CR=1 FL=1